MSNTLFHALVGYHSFCWSFAVKYSVFEIQKSAFYDFISTLNSSSDVNPDFFALELEPPKLRTTYLVGK